MDEKRRDVVIVQVCNELEQIGIVDLGDPSKLSNAQKEVIMEEFREWQKKIGEYENTLTVTALSIRAGKFAGDNAKNLILNPSGSLKNKLREEHIAQAKNNEKEELCQFWARYDRWANHDTSKNAGHVQNFRNANLLMYYVFALNPENVDFRLIYNLMRRATNNENFSDGDVRSKLLRPILRKFADWKKEGCPVSTRAYEIIRQRAEKTPKTRSEKTYEQ